MIIIVSKALIRWKLQSSAGPVYDETKNLYGV